MKLLRQKYTVYIDANLVPDEFLVKGENGGVFAYKDGFSFSYSVTLDGKEHVKISYSDWEGTEASSSHWKRYAWTGRDWKVIEQSKMKIS